MALFGANAVGQRVRVFWSDEDEWFSGRVEAFDVVQGLFVRYDDGDERWESSDQLVQLEDDSDLVEKREDGEHDDNNVASENERDERQQQRSRSRDASRHSDVDEGDTEESEVAQLEVPISHVADRPPQMMEPPASPSDAYDDEYSDEESKVQSDEATHGRRRSDRVTTSDEDDGVEQIDLATAVLADLKQDDSDNNNNRSDSDDDDNEQSIAMSEVPITFERIRATRSSTAQPQSTSASNNKRAVSNAQLPLRGVLRGRVLRASHLPSLSAPIASHERHALRPPRAFVKIAFAEASASGAAASSLMLRCKHALASTTVAPPSHDPVWNEQHLSSGIGDVSINDHDHMDNETLHSGDGAFEMQLVPPPRKATAPNEPPAWLQLRGDILFSIYSAAHSYADDSDGSAHRRVVHDFIGQAVVSLRDVLEHALFESLTLTRHLRLQTRQGKPLGRPRFRRSRALSGDDNSGSDSDDAKAVGAIAPSELVVAFAFEPTYPDDTRRRTRATSVQAKQRASSARSLLKDQRSSPSLASQPKTSDREHKTLSASKAAAAKKTTAPSHTSSSAINRRKFAKQVGHENAAFAKRIEWQHERRARRADLAKAQAKSKYPVPQHGSMKRDHKASSSVNRTKFQQQVTSENRAMEKRLHAIALKSEAKELRSRNAVGFDDPDKDKALARDRREERLREHDYLAARAQAKYQQQHRVVDDVMTLQSDIAALRAQVFATKASVNRLEILNNKDENLCRCLRSAAESSASSSSVSSTKAPSAKRTASSRATSASSASTESSASVTRHRKELELLQTEAASLASEMQRVSWELETCNQQEQALDSELARLDAQLCFVQAKQAFQARMRGKGSSSGNELRRAQEMAAKQQHLELSRDEEEQWRLYQAQQELLQLQIAVQVLQQQQNGASGLGAATNSSSASATDRAATAACAYLEKKIAKQQLKLEQLETEQRRLEHEYDALVASGEYEALRKQVHELQQTLFLCQAQRKHVAAAQRHASAADATLQIELQRQAFDQQTETDVLFKRKR